MIESIILGLGTSHALVWWRERRHGAWALALGLVGLLGLAFDLWHHPHYAASILACVAAMMALALLAGQRSAAGLPLSPVLISSVGTLTLLLIATYDSGGRLLLWQEFKQGFKAGWQAAAEVSHTR